MVTTPKKEDRSMEDNEQIINRHNKEREEELRHLRRIKAQIEEDKREREKVIINTVEVKGDEKINEPQSPDACRIKIRDLVRQSTFQVFLNKDKTVADLYAAVEKHVGNINFILFNFQAGMELTGCKDMSLTELGLFPSGTIIMK